MKLKTLTLLTLCASMALTSCKKDKDDDKKEETPASVEGTWKMTAQTETTTFGGQSSTENTYADMDACEKDDLTRFNADKTVTSLPGATKCDPSEPASEPYGTWALLNDNTKLRLIDGGDTTDAVVSTLNTTTLALKMTESYMGITYTINSTFTKQ
jgi:outer membrane receptor for ferric coprogen and ferric-rhodotorulic acid